MKKIVTVIIIFVILIWATFFVLEKTSTSGKEAAHQESVETVASQQSSLNSHDQVTAPSTSQQSALHSSSSARSQATSDAAMISNLPSPNTNSTVPLSQQTAELGQSQPVANGQAAIQLVQSLPSQTQNASYQLVPDKLFGNTNPNIFDVKILSMGSPNEPANTPMGLYRVYRDGHYELLQPYTYFDWPTSADQMGQGLPVSTGQAAINLIASEDADPDHNYRLVYDPLFLTNNSDIFDVQVLSKHYQALGKPGIEGLYRVYRDGHYEFLRP